MRVACVECGKVFARYHSQDVYCGVTCRGRARSRRYKNKHGERYYAIRRRKKYRFRYPVFTDRALSFRYLGKLILSGRVTAEQAKALRDKVECGETLSVFYLPRRKKGSNHGTNQGEARDCG